MRLYVPLHFRLCGYFFSPIDFWLLSSSPSQLLLNTLCASSPAVYINNETQLEQSQSQLEMGKNAKFWTRVRFGFLDKNCSVGVLSTF